MKAHGTTVFMQDGAPCHRVRAVKDLVGREGWTIMEWPGNSPDCNPIENMWNWMKDRLEEEYITTVPNLKRAIVKFWCQVVNDTDYCQRVVASMPRRLQAIIDNQGGHTKY